MKQGPRNLITDVAGLRVGHAHDKGLRSGTTVLTADAPFVAAVSVMGGAPGTRETDLLAPHNMVQAVDALVLSGGSAFGLGACGGVADGLRAMGRGFAVGDVRVPIVPGAILFDLRNGGDKGWTTNPYPALGRAALKAAKPSFDLGSVGAGYGATTSYWKGGLGSASAVLSNKITVGALVAVNAVGSVTAGKSRRFWAAPWEIDAEFGAVGLPAVLVAEDEPLLTKQQGEATTLAIVATDAALTQAQAKRIAIAAQDGIARAIVPSHTPFDGDLVFGVSTGQRPVTDEDLFLLGHAAASTLARAIARAVYEATPQPGDLQHVWRNGLA
ncbi:P1 family peptidase [Falsirhodobacter sp. alg1]|uniref:P1 family peptidase n=1 Tax=Falsirhodobacter sp. alg1 TaxID=1472418 RepID=UPI0005EFF858|nr:P1 family peptidase [Falsirhodobacter sp. alg1]